MNYYSLKNILSRNAQYNVIFGERSNGKTYACLKYALTESYKNGKQFAYVRRNKEDFVGKRGSALFDALIANNEIKKITHGEWTGVYYYASRWFLCKYDEDGKRITAENPIALGFALSDSEHDKSASFPHITTIIFDEFITRQYYLIDEFTIFANVVSTIIRQRIDVKIFMLGNTVNKYSCPYFSEMGLTHVKEMKQGVIDVYTYGETELRVAVEYCDSVSKAGKPNDYYFAFDNPKLSMIKSGSWEMAIYPHLPYKYKPKDILFMYFIKFDGVWLQCEIINNDEINATYTFIHPKTTSLTRQEEKYALIYSNDYCALPNWKRRINKPISNLMKRIYEYYTQERVYYATNETGEIVRNYLQWCSR